MKNELSNQNKSLLSAFFSVFFGLCGILSLAYFKDGEMTLFFIIMTFLCISLALYYFNKSENE